MVQSENIIGPRMVAGDCNGERRLKLRGTTVRLAEQVAMLPAQFPVGTCELSVCDELR